MTKRVTLSFDNGPTPDVTDYVLDVLSERGIRSSFFVIGQKLVNDDGWACVRRAHAEGHWIGNHTTTHEVLFGTSEDPSLADAEIEGAQSLIGDLAHPDRLFRPYAGGGVLDRRVLSPATLHHLLQRGYTCVTWNSIPRDWEQPTQWVDNVMEHVSGQDWTLTVLHDLDTGAMTQLPRFLDLLAEAGVQVAQEFPPECLPIVRGEQLVSLEHLMPAGASQS